jgi:hypothetical protein
VRRSAIVLTVTAAWVGVVSGHIVAYLLGYPSAGPRHAHLAVTGHSWTGLAAVSLLAVVPVVLLAVAALAVRTESPWSGSGLAFRLAAIQLPAFALIEVMERQWSVGRAAADPAVFIGLVLQPLVAVLAAWILDLFRRAVRAAVERFHRTRRVAPRSYPRPALGQVRPRHRLLIPARRRAPPPLEPA